MCQSVSGTGAALSSNQLVSYLQQVSAGHWHDPTITGLTNLSGFAWDMPDFSTESPASQKNRDSWSPYTFLVRKSDQRGEVVGPRPSCQVRVQRIHSGSGREQQRNQGHPDQINFEGPGHVLFWTRVAKPQHRVRAGELGRPGCHPCQCLEGCLLVKQFGNLQFVL